MQLLFAFAPDYAEKALQPRRLHGWLAENFLKDFARKDVAEVV